MIKMKDIKKFLCTRKKELLLALYVPIYIGLFFLVEFIIDEGVDYFPSYISLDSIIPFVPGFVIFYYLWYPFLLFTGLWLLYKDLTVYRAYMYSIMWTFTFFLIFSFIIPNGQQLRPEYLGDGVFNAMIGGIYNADTCTNVMPSVHSIGAILAAMALFFSRTVSSFMKLLGVLLGILICASTCLIKQHSILDTLAIIPMMFFVYFLYFKSEKQDRK